MKDPIELTCYTGLYNKLVWENVWKNKKLIKDILTNVSSEYEEATGFSWDEDLSVVKISNVPIEALSAYRKDTYKDDEDIHPLLNNIERIAALKKYTLFLLDLYPYKNIIKTELM
jgi:hypothetical protein